MNRTGPPVFIYKRAARVMLESRPGPLLIHSSGKVP